MLLNMRKWIYVCLLYEDIDGVRKEGRFFHQVFGLVVLPDKGLENGHHVR